MLVETRNIHIGTRMYIYMYVCRRRRPYRENKGNREVKKKEEKADE